MKKITIETNLAWHHLNIHEMFDFRWVFFMLILRDIKLRYKQTALGVVWVLLQPLLTALLFTAVFGKIMKVPTGGVPYVLFAFCGLVPWMFFSQSLQRASNCMVNDSRLITKVYFPRIFIPMAATFGVLIDFFITLLLTCALMFSFKHPLSINFAFLPICALVLIAFSLGINVFFSSVSVYYRDFKHIIPFLVQLWMYASPLVYSGEMIPEPYRPLYYLNPMAGIIDTFRWSILGNAPFPVYPFFMALAVSLILLGLGTGIFRKIERYFADII